MVTYVDNEELRDLMGRSRPMWRRGVTLRAIVKQRRLSHTQIAKYVGVSQVAVSRWCQGLDTPGANNLLRLTAALGVSASFLSEGTADEIKLLTRAIRPGEFHAELHEDTSDSVENHEGKISKRQRDLAARARSESEVAAKRAEEIETRRVLRIALANPALKGDWRARIAIAGKRCMFCAAPMASEGICSDCMRWGREE